MPILPLPHVGWFVAALFFLRNAANWFHLERRNDAQEVGEFLFSAGILAFGLHALLRRGEIALTSAAEVAVAPAAPAAVVMRTAESPTSSQRPS